MARFGNLQRFKKKKNHCHSKDIGDILWNHKGFQSKIVEDKYQPKTTDVSGLTNDLSTERDKNPIFNQCFSLKRKMEQTPMNLLQNQPNKLLILSEEHASSSKAYRLEELKLSEDVKSKLKTDNLRLKFMKETPGEKSNGMKKKAFQKLNFDRGVFEKKNWTVYHEDERHEQLCKWIGSPSDKKLSMNEIREKLHILQSGFASISKKQTRSLQKGLHNINLAQINRAALLERSILILFKNKDKWTPYWKSKVNSSLELNLSGKKNQSVVRIWKIFCAVLFYSDMIDTICETLRIDENIPKIPLIELSANHFNEMQSNGFFCDENILSKKRRPGKNGDYTKNDFIKKRFKIPRLVWRYLLLIIRICNRPEIQKYSLLTNGSLSIHFKSFFNDLFSYSIINFNDLILDYNEERN